jgi:nitrogen fixation NifU-like protein
MDHQRSPRNYGHVEHSHHQEEGYNPLCGDRVSLTFRFDEKGEVIKEVAFEGQGCSICMASASILMEETEGLKKEEAMEKIQDFRGLMQGEKSPEQFEGDVRALSGVRRFPVRIKCALLPWMTMKKAIEVKEDQKKEEGK